MTSTDNQLFTAEEAFIRLGQNRGQGCLLVSKGHELIHIFVQDGFIISAFGGLKSGMEVIEHALHLSDSSYTWLRGAKPADQNIRLPIQEYALKHASIHKKASETNKLASGVEKKKNEVQFKYFLIAQKHPTIKLPLTRVTTVLGRDESSDLVIESTEISRRHCLLDIQPRGLYVKDLNSTNGTFINGILMNDGYLNAGDRLELGAYTLTVNREPLVPIR